MKLSQLEAPLLKLGLSFKISSGAPHTSDSLRLEVDDVDFTVIADQFNSPAIVNEFGKVAALMCRFEVIKKKLATIKKT